MHVFHERNEGGVRRNHQSTAQRQPRYIKQDLDTLLCLLLQPDQPLILHVRNSAVPSHKLLSALRSKITITLFFALFNILTHNCISKVVAICPLEFKICHSLFSLNSPIHTYNVIRTHLETQLFGTYSSSASVSVYQLCGFQLCAKN